ILISLIACIIPLCLAAQGAGPAGGMNAVAMPYGSGQTPNLVYSGETAPSNILLLSFGNQIIFDDNIFGASGTGKQSDIITNFESNVLLFHEGERVTLAAEYLPYLQLYRNFTGYDRLSQELSADVTFKPSIQWDLRVRESF